MFCKHCGTAVSDDSKFCYKCGKQLYADVITKETPIGVFTSTVEMEDSAESQTENTNNQYNFADYTNKPEEEHSLIENVKVQDGFFFRHITKKKKVVYTLFAILIAIWTAVAVVMMFFPQYTSLL